MMAADLGKSVGGIVLALLVVAVFLVRRVGGPGGGPPPFDPDDYRDVPVLAPEEAARHVGERARVCGDVAATNYARRVQGRPTFLNLDRPYPDQPFDVVIWGRYRGNFARPPELRYRETRICASGRISEHEGVPRIEIRVPKQIREQRREEASPS